MMNVTGNDKKVITIYFIMTAFYVFASFIFMYFYWRRSLEWRYKKHSHQDRFMDHDVALHSIMVSNLNKSLDMETINEHLDLVFTKVF
jgi:heme/copper-type cytochrome/quinol oxidase subunit 3